MIISASRRTDLPAFYGEWFLNRLEAGWCRVTNPFNARQISEVSLQPAEVDAFVFWTKNPGPFMTALAELDRRGFHYYFQFTLNHYPPELEPGLPPLEQRVEMFRELAGRLGPERVVWRYDPIIISNRTDWDYHRRAFGRLCTVLGGSTHRVMLSLLSPYAKTRRRLARLEAAGYRFRLDDAWQDAQATPLLTDMAGLARAAGITPRSCAVPWDWRPLGIAPGACVDGDLITRLWGGNPGRARDTGQRPDCRCTKSRDIGANNTCLHDCLYCYATTSEGAARKRHAAHDAAGPSMA